MRNYVAIAEDCDSYLVIYAGNSESLAVEAVERERYGHVELQEWENGRLVRSRFYNAAYRSWD